jgi:hypothetical protein
LSAGLDTNSMASSRLRSANVRAGSIQTIAAVLARRMVDFERHGRWLPRSNRYRTDTVSRLEKDVGAAVVAERDLVQYVAVSVPLHLVDGWSFWGRALGAYLQGDFASLVHLAYYAELRAAMALLGSAGIGVFSQYHFSANTRQTVLEVEKRSKSGRGVGTHAIVWPLLRARARHRESAEHVLGRLRGGQASIWDWLSSFSVGNRVALSARWLEAWGLDLIEDDHHLRNVASYRPSALREHGSSSFTDRVEFVSALWSLAEPGAGRSLAVDRYLLRAALRQIVPTQAGLTLAQVIQAATANAGEDLGVWLPFLSAPATHDPLPLRIASESNAADQATAGQQILARAFLLLRAAGASTSASLQGASGVSSWLSSFGIQRCLWSETQTAAEMVDRWADLSETLGRLRSLSAPPSGPSHPDWTVVAGVAMGEFGLVWSLANG